MEWRKAIFIGFLACLAACTSPKPPKSTQENFRPIYPAGLIVETQVFQRAPVGSLARTRASGAEDEFSTAWEGPFESLSCGECPIMLPAEVILRGLFGVGAAAAGAASGVDQTEQEIFEAHDGVNRGFDPKSASRAIQSSIVSKLAVLGKDVGVRCVGGKSDCTHVPDKEVIYQSVAFLVDKAAEPRGRADIDLVADVTTAQTSNARPWRCRTWVYRRPLGDLFKAGRNDGKVVRDAIQASAIDLGSAVSAQLSGVDLFEFPGGATLKVVTTNQSLCEINKEFALEIRRNQP